MICKIMNIATKHLCILVPAPLFLYPVPYLHQFCAVENGAIWDKFVLYLMQI